MSRIGKLPISIPAGVTVTLKENVVNVKGPKGELSQFVNPAIIVEVADGHVVLKENEEAMLDNLKQRHAFHGLYRALINNMVVGVSEGYKKELELVGVGYRASNNGNIIDFALGYTHNIFMQLPPEITLFPMRQPPGRLVSTRPRRASSGPNSITDDRICPASVSGISAAEREAAEILRRSPSSRHSAPRAFKIPSIQKTSCILGICSSTVVPL